MTRVVSCFGALAAGMMLAAPVAQAAPVDFQLSPVTFISGSGYGADASEAGGTLLGVSFSATVGAINFALNAVNDSFLFAFGSVTLDESGLINASETDNLGVAATFAFADPFAGLRNVIASGSATVGLVGDPAIDLTIDWNPVDVSFGNGGAFRIEMNTLNFDSSGQTRTQAARITLLAAPVPVPEPATLALVAAALGGLALSRRRPKSA